MNTKFHYNKSYLSMVLSLLLFTFVLLSGKPDKVFAATQITSNTQSLTSPQKAKAVDLQTITTIYDFFTKPEETFETNITNWTKSAVTAGTVNVGISLICGGDFIDEDLIAQSQADYDPENPDSGRACVSVDDYAINAKYGEYGRVPGGLANALVSTTAYVFDDPPVPTDMAYFINDVFDNTLFGNDVYAADVFTGGFKDGVFDFWKGSRNIAVSLLALVVGVIGLMIMLRYKISPQVVASLYNTLPYIPIGLAFILLSYPIVTFILSAIWPLSAFAMAFAYHIGGMLVEAQSGLTADSNFLSYLAVGINNLIRMFHPTSFVSIIFMIGAALSLIVTIGVSLFKVIFVYLRFVWYVIAAPFVGVAFMIPGNQGILIAYLKKLFIEIITIPVILFTLMLGIMIIASNLYTTGGGSSTGDFISTALVNMSGISLFWSVVKIVIAEIIIYKGSKAGKLLKEAFGIEKGIFYNPKPKR